VGRRGHRQTPERAEKRPAQAGGELERARWRPGDDPGDRGVLDRRELIDTQPYRRGRRQRFGQAGGHVRRQLGGRATRFARDHDQAVAKRVDIAATVLGRAELPDAAPLATAVVAGASALISAALFTALDD